MSSPFQHFRALSPGIVFALIALVIALPSAASAHESRTVDDEITIETGFITEPPIQNDTNGLRVAVTSGAEPIEGLESSLGATANFAGEARELPLTPVEGEPGVYVSVFIPTQPGEYSFQITGSINDQTIDETFHSSPDGVPLVASRLDYEFPTAAHGDVTNLAYPAGAVLLLAGMTVVIRRLRNQA